MLDIWRDCTTKRKEEKEQMKKEVERRLQIRLRRTTRERAILRIIKQSAQGCI